MKVNYFDLSLITLEADGSIEAWVRLRYNLDNGFGTV